MKKLLWLTMLILVALLVLPILLFKLMGWPGLLLLPVLLVLGAMYLKSRAGKLLHKFLVTPFVMKGAVLKDARAEIHSVQAATRPARTFVQHYNEDNDEPGNDEMEVEDEGSNEYSRHFIIDVTISPQASETPFQMWEPGELVLVKMNTRSGDTDSEGVEVGSVFEVEVWAGGTWTQDEGLKYPGPQRLKLLVGVQDQVRACRFRYYFEVFGQIELPETILS